MVFGRRSGAPLTSDSYAPQHSIALRIALWALHFIVIVFSITVAGLYGTYLHRGAEKGVPADGRWVFAVVVAILSVITNIVYIIPLPLWRYLFPWDFILFFLWVVVTGIFGNLYAKEDPEGNKDIKMMKNAVWIDLVSLIFAFIIAVMHLTLFIRHRRNKTLWTGRATV